MTAVTALVIATLLNTVFTPAQPGHPTASNSAPVYTTYFVLDAELSASADLDPRVHSAIVAALADKGLVETSPRDAEAVVVIHTATRQRPSRQAFYAGWGGWQWHTSAIGTEVNATYKPGTLVIDVFDAWTKELVWHGSAPNVAQDGARGKLNPIRTALTRMLKTLPPATDRTVAGRAGGPPVGAHMQILFAAAPALLIQINGEPRYAEVAETRLQRITNAPAFIVRDESGIHYLRIGNRWMEAYEVTGTWSVAGLPPEGADLALKQAEVSPEYALFASAELAGRPCVFVRTTPADLVITAGEPEFSPVPGTLLQYVRNADVPVFKEPTDHAIYLRTTSGWYRAWTFDGPWQHVVDADLPADIRLRINR